jgi:CysZ protein
VVGWIFNFLGLSGEHQGIIGFLIGMLQFVMNLFVYFLVFIIYLSTYKYIVLMIMPPLLAVLSEKTDVLLSGRKYKFEIKQLLKDILRGLLIVLRNLFIELGFFIILFILGFIPIIGLICPFIVFIISMYYYGFSMIDYSNERARLSISQSVIFVRKNKGFAIANGLIFYILLMIPLLGLLIAPSYAVVAATIGVEKIRQKNK